MRRPLPSCWTRPAQDRDGEDFLSRDGLQTCVSKIMQQVGMEVICDAPLAAGGSSDVTLDIVATADGQQSIVRLEENPSLDDLDNVRGLLAQLKGAGMQGRLYPCHRHPERQQLGAGPLSGG